MQIIARAFAMDERTWERHASPWSCWTRVAILPLLCLAIWARVWIGWGCLIPIAALLVWTWVNPRAFPPPATTRAWASRAVMGERVWLNRGTVAIPRHHAVWAGLLSALPAAGLGPLIWGLYALEIWPLLLGLVLTMGPKLWFCDRMVWLYDDMARTHPAYAAWQR
ncbi:MAG: DUF6653 family protein [Pseudomonadota bacterium]